MATHAQIAARLLRDAAKWRQSVAAAQTADRTALLVVGCALLLAYAPRSHALDPAYLREWPSAEQVLADHQGKDRQDTLARQMAALHHLHRSVEDMADARRWQGLTADENRLRGEYYAAAERIRAEVTATLSNELPPGFNGPFAEPPLRKWYAQQWKYERDAQVRDRTLGRYLSPPLLAELGAKKSASDARADAAGRELDQALRPSERSTGTKYLVPWVAFAALALLIVLIRGRRRRAASREAVLPQSRATVPHPAVVAAAEEVMDCLAPYLDAARGDLERIPLGAFGDPFVVGFVLEYCSAAFARMSGTEEAGTEDGLRVFEQLSKSRRLAALVGGRDQHQSPPGPLSEADQASAGLGAGTARVVLRTFAGDMFKDTAAGRRQPMLNAQGTRLHPAGPYARNGEQAMMSLFVGKLTRIIAEAT